MADCANAIDGSVDFEHALGEIENRLGTVSLGLVRFCLLLINEPDISHEQAAERIGVDCRSVRRYEKSLVNHGFVEVGRVRGKDGSRIYRVLHFPQRSSAASAS